jgi:hypothetical protein
MFFGLTNSPSTFQEMMNVIYKEVIEKHAARGTIIRIYMDDIAIATSGTMQDHVDAVRDVLSVTILTGKTLDSAVMTTRAEMYH